MLIDPKTYYDDNYWTGKKTYKDGSGNERAYHGPSLEWEGFDVIHRILHPLLPGKTLLDIGCGGGALASRFLNSGREAYGLEISQYAIDNCLPAMKDRIDLGNISVYHPLRAETDRFDAVMATDLMEHIYEEDLEPTICNLINYTNKKGIIFLLIATTDGEQFVAKKNESIPPKWELTAVSGHVNVRNWKYWVKKFSEYKMDLRIRFDLMWRFQAEKDKIPWFNEMLAWGGDGTYFLERL